MRRLLFLFFCLSLFMPIFITHAQSQTVQCGDIIEGVFSESEQANRYVITMRSGEIIEAEAVVFGDFLRMVLGIISPTGDTLINSDGNGISATSLSRRGDSLSDRPAASSGVLSASGNYAIEVISAYTNGVGEYTLLISCIDREGRLTEAGDPFVEPNEPTQESNNQATALVNLQIDFGYPPNPGVDFSASAIFPLIFDIPLTSSIASNGNSVSGFRFEAAADDVLEISAERLQGNLNIGLVVFAEPNIPVFIAGPVSSSTFSTEITLPQDGNYVIGLFRMGDPPAGGQDTAFQIRVSLNP